jgi:hypothetical protein
MKSLVFFKRMSLAPGLLILFLGLQAQNDFSGTLANLPSTLANTIPHPVTTVIFGALTTLLNRPNR